MNEETGMIDFKCSICGASADYMDKQNHWYYCNRCVPPWLACKEARIHE